jgi:drug/metabolite transporter (DMT)-like permease
MALLQRRRQTASHAEQDKECRMNNATVSRPLGIAGLLVATSAWGSLFLVGKPLLSEVDPLWFTLIRYTIATLGFVAWLAARGPFPWAQLKAHAGRLALLGFLGYGVFSALVLVGLSHSVPSHGAVIMATMPITTQLVRWALDGQRPSTAALGAAALAFGGVVVVSGVLLGGQGDQREVLWGDVITLVGTLGWIAYTRGAARLPQLDPLQYGGLAAVASWPLLVLATLATTAMQCSPAPHAEALLRHWPALLYVGVLPSVVAISAYNAGVRALGVVTGTAFLNFVPVSVVIIGLALGHLPQPHELLGVALVVSALLLLTSSQRRGVQRQAACA